MATFALGWYLKPVPALDPVQDQPPSLTASERSLLGEKTKRGRADSKTSSGNMVAKSSADIAAIGDRLRRATDPIAKRAAFSELMASLTAENALEIRKQIAHLNADDPDFRDFHYAWGKVGGLNAVLHGLDTDKRDMGPTLAGWASADPESAKKWYETLEDNPDRGANQKAMKAALVHGLAISDPSIAADFVYSLGETGDKRAKEMMGIVMGKVIQSGGPEEAARWAATLSGGDELRGHALWEAGRAGIRENPEATLDWATAIANGDDPNAGSLTYGIAQEMGWRDGPKVAEWLGSLDGGSASAYGPLLGGWTKVDPMAASEFVAAMPPSENRDHAIGGMVYSHRWEDPAAAAAWATQLSSAEGREKVMTLAAEAYIHKDPTAAAEWLPTSGLPLETQERLVQAGNKGK